MDWDQPFDALVQKIMSWVEGAILTLPNLIAATLVVVVAWLASRAVRAALTRGLQRTGAPGQIQRLLRPYLAGVGVEVGCARVDHVREVGVEIAPNPVVGLAA